MARGLKFAGLVLMLALSAAILLAQQQFETGSIEGMIMSGVGPVSQASVEAHNEMSGAVSRTESDATGHYKLESIRPGRYSLWVQAPGCDSVLIPKLVVEAGEPTHRDIRLGRSHTTASGL